MRSAEDPKERITYMPPTRPGEIVIGDYRILPSGDIEIRGHRTWIPYPEEASSFLVWADSRGWGIDDGLPTRNTLDGDVFVRILVGRERGPNALDPESISQATQFHITWTLTRTTDAWAIGAGYVKVGTKQSKWDYIKVSAARKLIAANPVILPYEHVSQKENYAC